MPKISTSKAKPKSNITTHKPSSSAAKPTGISSKSHAVHKPTVSAYGAGETARASQSTTRQLRSDTDRIRELKRKPGPEINYENNTSKIIRMILKHDGPDPGMFDYKKGLTYKGGCQGCGLASMCFGPLYCKKTFKELGKVVPHPHVYIDRTKYTVCPFRDDILASPAFRTVQGPRPRKYPQGEPINKPGYHNCQCCNGLINPHLNGAGFY